MDLALNNLQRLIHHKTQPTNQPTNLQTYAFIHPAKDLPEIYVDHFKNLVWFGFRFFNGISTITGYLMSKPSL